MLRNIRTAATVAVALAVLSVPALSQPAKPTPQPTASPAAVELFKMNPGVEAEWKRISAAADKREAEQYLKLGQAAWKQLEITATIDNYTKAIDLVPGYTDALRERGTVYFLIGRHEDAVRDLSAVLESQPAAPSALFYRGMSYAALAKAYMISSTRSGEASGLADKAYADFNAAIKLDASNALYYNGRGSLCLDFQLYKEAIDNFEKAISLDAKFAAAYTNLGRAKSSTAGTGLPELNRAIELNPRFGEAYYNRADYHRAKGSLDEAIADYTRAITENNTNADYYNSRGLAYYAKGRGDLAVKDFTSAIGQKADFAIGYLNRALTYKQFPGTASDESDSSIGGAIVAQRRKMKADLDAAIRYNPNLANAYLERGLMDSTWVGSKLDDAAIARLNKAADDFGRAIKLDPRAAQAYGARAAIYERFEKRDDALADYNKAIEIDPMLATAYMGRMAIYCKMGKTDLSIADENKVKELGFAALNICSLRK